ncbi:MAG: hypothetical protein ABI702_20215 [Burkholderiales bacterium]
MKAALSLLFVVPVVAAVTAQQPTPPRALWSSAPLQDVASVDELRANTPAEQAAAEWLHGRVPLRPGNWGMGRGLEVSVSSQSSPADLLELEVCRADAIVAGHSAASHVIVDDQQTTLIMVDRLIASDWVKPQKGPADIEVFTLGGEVEIGNARYAMEYDGEGSWLIDGQPMLLFLQVRRPGAYLNRSREMSILIADGRVKLVGAEGPLPNVIAKLRAISARCPARSTTSSGRGPA